MSRSKRVSDNALERISIALDRLAADPSLRRTKIEVERLSGLSHDAVARAFRQEAEEPGSKWQLANRFQQLVDPEHGRRSPHDAALHEAKRTLQEKQAEVTRLEHDLDRYAMALYAYYLTSQSRDPQASEETPVVPIGRNRPRKR